MSIKRWGALCALLLGAVAHAEVGPPEKEALRLGFIKLTDMAPLAVAYEKGYFEEEGLYVTLEPQANWKVLLDRVIGGELDGAQMLAGQPLAAHVGIGTRAELVTALSLDRNGNAITVANAVWQQMQPALAGHTGPVSAAALKPVVEQYRSQGKPFNMGMVFPVSTHNYELRYWLAAGGLHPGYYAPARGDNTGQLDAQVLLSVTPPPQMPATLEAGTITGYCVGEPWNQQALAKGLGVPVITDAEIWDSNPEKVLGVTRAFAERYPNTHVRLVKALLRAARWLDEGENRNRSEAVTLLARPDYVGADQPVIAAAMTGTFRYGKEDVRPAPDFTLFFRRHASYPYYSDAVWMLTQMRRWGQIPTGQSDAWYDAVARAVYRPEVYRQAAEALVAEGKFKAGEFVDFASESGYRPAESGFIDGHTFDARRPNDYLNQFAIGLKGDERVQ
ncbi:CmpA/NrtA family ABC transporter substrate-binding protein [Aeromonas sp. R6-2]|uniref:CmpA/NrtA family ABC transporter substrate-binding protein n=1 Tax=Aeromonas sp. R6-2 TaxID=3138472 RepID=UPI0034A5D1BE